MIALDTSSVIAYLAGESGQDVEEVAMALEQRQVVFPPVVLSELLSDPKLPAHITKLLKDIPLLPVISGYWERAGLLRSKIIARGFKAPLADSLIAQSCLDHHVSLITRDTDFRHFERWEGMGLTGVLTAPQSRQKFLHRKNRYFSNPPRS